MSWLLRLLVVFFIFFQYILVLLLFLFRYHFYIDDSNHAVKCLCHTLSCRGTSNYIYILLNVLVRSLQCRCFCFVHSRDLSLSLSLVTHLHKCVILESEQKRLDLKSNKKGERITDTGCLGNIMASSRQASARYGCFVWKWFDMASKHSSLSKLISSHF